MRRTIALASACFALACGGSTDSDPGGGSGGATGGASSGGAPSGGSAGTGAVSGSGGGSVGGSPGTGGITGVGPDCTSDEECTLFTDCCTCTAYGPNEAPPPSCLADCTKTACDIVGANADTVQCILGRCVAGIQCDPIQVFCNGLPPECGPGLVASVMNGCWGGCVPATECTSVASCNECDAPLTTCVTVDLSGGDANPSHHCVDVPKGCEGTANCACMGTNVCISPTSECIDLSGLPGMACVCAACD